VNKFFSIAFIIWHTGFLVSFWRAKYSNTWEELLSRTGLSLAWPAFLGLKTYDRTKARAKPTVTSANNITL
jgi:hypothetical protein